jgi:TolA-binding protein
MRPHSDVQPSTNVAPPVPEASATVPAVQPDARPALSDASRAFEQAMNALARGDNESAASHFLAFSKTFPSDPRTDEADYLRAIALQRAGHTNDAASAGKHYLEARPGGAHRVDAKTIAGN